MSCVHPSETVQYFVTLGDQHAAFENAGLLYVLQTGLGGFGEVVEGEDDVTKGQASQIVCDEISVISTQTLLSCVDI